MYFFVSVSGVKLDSALLVGCTSPGVRLLVCPGSGAEPGVLAVAVRPGSGAEPG